MQPRNVNGAHKISFKLSVWVSWNWRLVRAHRWMLHTQIRRNKKASSLYHLAERFCVLHLSAYCHHHFTPYYPHVALPAHVWVLMVLCYGKVWGERARWKAKHSHFIASLQPDGVCPLCPKNHTGDVRFRGNQLKLMTVSDKGLFSKRVSCGSWLSSLQLSMYQSSNLLSQSWHICEQQVKHNIELLSMNICWQRQICHQHYR